MCAKILERVFCATVSVLVASRVEMCTPVWSECVFQMRYLWLYIPHWPWWLLLMHIL